MVVIGAARELTSDVEPLKKAQIFTTCRGYIDGLSEDDALLFDHWMDVFAAGRAGSS